MKRFLTLLLCVLLFALPALADEPLKDKEPAKLTEVLNALDQQVKNLKYLGAVDAAARLEGHAGELKKVDFWKEATGPIDSTMLMLGRLKSGETDCAYRLPGAGNTIYLRDCFFSYYAPQGTPRAKLEKLEQISVLIHENMHLHRGAGDKDAYIEQYKWLRTFGVNRDETVDWVLQADGKTKSECPTMKNVVIKLKALGVSLDELEKDIFSPILARRWTGTMIILETPYADSFLKDVPPEARRFMAAMFPGRGTVYPFKLMVEQHGTNLAKGMVEGVPGQGGRVDIEMDADGLDSQQVRAHQLYIVPGPEGKKKDLEYFWKGRTEGDRATGTWEAFFVDGKGSRETCYSGTWAVQRTKN